MHVLIRPVHLQLVAKVNPFVGNWQVYRMSESCSGFCVCVCVCLACLRPNVSHLKDFIFPTSEFSPVFRRKKKKSRLDLCVCVCIKLDFFSTSNLNCEPRRLVKLNPI